MKENEVIELVSPLGHPRVQAQAARRVLEILAGRSVGFIWNQYQATGNFWPRLERALEELCRPRAVARAYKANTWSPLEKERFRELARGADYLVVGVGA
jgi:hypothetical protein